MRELQRAQVADVAIWDSGGRGREGLKRTGFARQVQVLELGQEERLLEHAEHDHRADPVLQTHQVAPVEAQHRQPRDRHQHVQHRHAHVELAPEGVQWSTSTKHTYKEYE